MREMTKDHAASLELVRCYERNQWTGSLGEKREAHRRPSWIARMWNRWFA